MKYNSIKTFLKFTIVGILSFNVLILFAQTPQYFKDLQTKKQTSTKDVNWTNVGPGMSGYNEIYYAHPTDPNSMYMSLDMGNSFYTHDNGLNWTTTKDWDTDGEKGRTMDADFSRQNPDFGFAIDDTGKLMVTHNRGTSYQWVKSWPKTKKYSCITVDPNNDNNWYIGSGQFWRVKKMHRSKAKPHGTIPLPSTEYGHIYISKDKGASWTKIKDNFNSDLDVAKIFVDPRNSDVVYTFTNYGFYKSTDGGYTWKLKGKGLPYNLPRDGGIFFNKKTNDVTLYLVEQTNYIDNDKGGVKTSGGVFNSTDGGENWTSILGDLPFDLNKIKSYDITVRYYKTMAHWFGISINEAKKRFPNKPSFTYPVFNKLAISKTNSDEIYLSANVGHDKSFGPELWVSKNGGKHWEVCLRTGAYWVKNTDKEYWLSRNQPLGMNANFAHLHKEKEEEKVSSSVRMLFSKVNGEIITGYGQQTLRSIDQGTTWQQIDDDETTVGSNAWVSRGGSNLPGHDILLETGMSDYLFCAGEHGLWKTAPGGENIKPDAVAVTQIEGQSQGNSKDNKHSSSVAAVAVHPNDVNTLYILSFRQNNRGAFRKSTDGGKTWKNISQPITDSSKLTNEIEQKDLLIDKQNPNNIFFCVPFEDHAPWAKELRVINGRKANRDFKVGVYRSQDGGYTWDVVGKGLPKGANVFRLEMDPENSKILYASVNRTIDKSVKGGLFKSVDSGTTWSKIKIPSEIKSVNHFSINKKTGNWYLSAGEAVGEIDAGGTWISKNKGKKWKKIFFMPNVFETYSSNVDPNTILVNVQMGRKIKNINPGFYFSKDGGNSWTKANYQLGQPARIMTIKPDIKDANIFWLATYGSGFYRGIYKAK